MNQPVDTAHADLVLETHQSRLCGLPPGAKRGDVVLLTAQVEPLQNGLWRVHAGQWHRVLNWTKKSPMDGDPWWDAQVGPFVLQVSVPTGAPWFWEWSVVYDPHHPTYPDVELVRGDLYVEHDDADEDQWDYQDVGLAQARAEAVAYALLALEGSSNAH